ASSPATPAATPPQLTSGSQSTSQAVSSHDYRDRRCGRVRRRVRMLPDSHRKAPRRRERRLHPMSLALAPLDDQETHELAARVVKNEVYLLFASMREEIDLSFGTILALSGMTPEDGAQVGAVYEEIGKAMPHSINGRPVFFSLCAVHVDSC